MSSPVKIWKPDQETANAMADLDRLKKDYETSRAAAHKTLGTAIKIGAVALFGLTWLFVGLWSAIWRTAVAWVVFQGLAALFISARFAQKRKAVDQQDELAFRLFEDKARETLKATTIATNGGGYHWRYNSQDVKFLGVIKKTGAVFYIGEKTHWRYMLVPPENIRQVLVKTETSETHTAHTDTRHEKVRVRALSVGAVTFGSAKPGRSSSTTTHSTRRTEFHTLKIQYLDAHHNLDWLEWNFGTDHNDAENWKTLIQDGMRQLAAS